MDRPSALAYLNARVLSAFSARTTTELRTALPLRLALPHIEPVLELNVRKEIRKDALVIRTAALETSATPDLATVRRLFAETRRIDDDFVTRADGFRLRVIIPYAEIEPLRVERITRLMTATGRVLVAWREHGILRSALRGAFTQIELEATLRRILDLYGREVRVLTRSVRLPLLIEPIRERLAQHLLTVMAHSGGRLAADIARAVYRTA